MVILRYYFILIALKFVNRATSPRGAGYLFGAKVTHDFMRINNLSLICRAHQLVHEGIAYLLLLLRYLVYLFVEHDTIRIKFSIL